MRKYNGLMKRYYKLLDYKYINDICTTISENEVTDGFLIVPSKMFMRSFHDFFYEHLISEFDPTWIKEKCFLLIFCEGKIDIIYSQTNSKELFEEFLRDCFNEENYPIIYKTIKEKYEEYRS